MHDGTTTRRHDDTTVPSARNTEITELTKLTKK